MSGGANVTVTIGAAFAGSFRSVLGAADRELKSFGRHATRSMKAFGRESERAAKGVAAMGTAAKSMQTYATAGAKAARSTKSISAATVKMTKAQVRAAKAAKGANGNAASIMGLPSKAMVRDAERTMKSFRRSMKPVATNDLTETAAAMPKAYKRAVRESVAHVRAGSREIRRAMAEAPGGNVASAMAGMPAGFGKAVGNLPGVTMGGKASRPATVANNAHPGPPAPPAPPRSASGLPLIRAAPVPAPWGAPAAPLPPTPPVGGGRGRGGRGAGGGGPIPPAPPARGRAPGRRGGRAARRPGGGGHGMHTHDGGAIGGAVVGAFSARSVWEAVQSAGEVNDLQILLKLQGRTTSEIQEATNAARRIALKNPAISTAEALRGIIDVADTGDRDLKKAARLAPLIARSSKAVSILADEEAKGRMGEGQSRYLGRAIEDMGKGTKSEGEIKAFVDAITAGTIATRGIFNPKELFQTIQKSGGMARGWDNEFTGKVLPAIAMAMGGSGAGDALYMFGKGFAKGQVQLSSAKAMMEMGLINSKDLLYDGKKFLGIRPDAMPDAEGLRKNPYDWFKKTVIPAALRSAGITDIGAERRRFEGQHGNDADLSGLSDDDRRAKLNDKFRTHIDDTLQRQSDTFAKAKNFSKMIADFIAQVEQIDHQIAQIGRQPVNALDIMFSENFKAQTEAVSKSFHSLMAAMGAPEVGTAIAAMDGLARGMAGLASVATADPESTKKVMAAFAAITAGLATFGTVALSSTVLGAMAAGGPVTLALVAVGATMAAWAALDWDSFSESMSNLLAIGQGLKSALDFLDSLGTDAKGNSLIGKAVSAMLGNREQDNDAGALAGKEKARDAAKERLEKYDPKARGSFPGQRAGLEDDLKRAEEAVVAQREQNEKFEAKKRKKEEAAAKATKALSDAEQAAKDLTDRRNAAKALEAHTVHSDAATQEALDAYQPKSESAESPRKRPGRKPGSFEKGALPLSEENVVIRKEPVKPSAPEVMEKAAPMASPATPGASVVPSVRDALAFRPHGPLPDPKSLEEKIPNASAADRDKYVQTVLPNRGTPIPVTITGPTPGQTSAAPVKPVAPERVAGSAVKAMECPTPMPITGPTPGQQGAPAVPGAAVAAGGKTVVDIAGPVSIKDDVGVKQPLRLVAPVLISAQGILAVHDSATAAGVTGMSAAIAGMAASLSSIQASTAATAAACQAIAAKDFSPQITVQGGGGSAGASRERSSFSD
ncbi:hypothetical protein [Methylobacterium sp. AMS5]|uniref:hypothetical protein n=1 Tax=Methylobacterium sp. AMS5 TaxID=925818 RepID=UPI00074FA330|nr:hypothetical protein [Methylobacterium sp. AMS5]AMB46899.1 hypothetical protein Y590_18335 [Methylobacterium sp. AMS5]